MTTGDGRGGIDRRRVLLGAAATAALAACGGGDDGAASTTTGPAGGGSPTTRFAARLAGDPFGLGVASGDPDPTSVILWTRLAPDPLADDGRGAMPDDRVDVRWQVADDDRFTRVVAEGIATADPAHGHSLHVEAGGLEPATDYRYRFSVGEWTSPVGRTRTLPEAGTTPTGFRLAIANCQWIDTGRYGAYRHMAEEDLDLVLHLGDYIYEYPGERARPDRIPESLDDYRLRYASYKVDPDLQRVHHRFPFVCTWDDHEVRNNVMGDTLPEDLPADEVRALRAAAYQAWWEHLPVRLDPPDGADLPVHRHLDIGTLARLYVLDLRQHADLPPCRDTDTAIGDAGDCPERLADPERTNLGAQQEGWFAEATAASEATWNLVGNPVVLAGIDTGPAGGDTGGVPGEGGDTGGVPGEGGDTGGVPGEGGTSSIYYLDTWDGFPGARERLIEAMAGTSNPVVLTGDYHAGMVLDVHRRPFDPESEVVATELLSPAISSPLFPIDVSPRTPHLRQQINAHGYLTVEVEPEHLTAAFRVLDDVTDLGSPIRTEATWRIEAGSPRATRA